MKKSIIAAALAGVVLLAGCSGVSQESYDSVVAENEKLKSEINEMKGKNESNTSNEDEYLSKDYVKRLMNSFAFDGETNIVDGEIEQYNVKISQILISDKNNDDKYVRGKSVMLLKSQNTPQEKAAFCHYYVEDTLNQSLGEPFENAADDVADGSEIINILIDDSGEPFYIWLAFKENGKSTIDFKYLDDNVLNALDEVKADPDKWKYVQTDTSSLPQSNDTSSNSFVTSNSTSSTPTISSSNTSQPIQSTAPPTPTITVTTGERNAMKKAQSYLDFTAFSRDGLISQLEFEGFTKSEATYGADNVGANWNEQAVAKAKSYLEFTAFSYSGLVEQLEFEEFTHEQAVYGADKCGANWNEQAAKKAESYLELMAFSRDSLIEQLEFEGFTYEQAVYGAAQNGY